ncbi:MULTISPECIES: hypothetical protein [Tepidibacillus]|uniref:FeoB-associated Cys-rich membrane protein n=1 Tax=Tepidibacillus fermentans TaxID=1281767 RepID=A0A4R3KIG8_9BACI|nr:hypothetical protein [Tepidibacillus fermentans]TCS82471.1 hypothetical protein EDD72_10940 [Tepidibacillus fermentans]
MMISYLLAAVIVIYSGFVLIKVMRKRLKGECCFHQTNEMKKGEEERS